LLAFHGVLVREGTIKTSWLTLSVLQVSGVAGETRVGTVAGSALAGACCARSLVSVLASWANIETFESNGSVHHLGVLRVVICANHTLIVASTCASLARQITLLAVGEVHDEHVRSGVDVGDLVLQ
jgi:hypothetical protein